MAINLQPVTTPAHLAALCPHATKWGQAGLSSHRARKELLSVFPLWHWFCGDLHLGESTSKNMEFAPILNDGFVPKHIQGWFRGTQSVRNAQERTQTSYFLENKLFDLIRTSFLS